MSIKLGEMMDQPRHQRIAKMAKEEEERKKGQEQQQQSKKEIEARKARLERQKELNRQAYDYIHPIFKRLAGVKPISLQGEQRRLAQRFQNRLELRMIIMDLAALRMIGPGQYKSMGTGGMKNEEVRALRHKLALEVELLNTSADAVRLVEMLDKKIESLPMQLNCSGPPSAAARARRARRRRRRLRLRRRRRRGVGRVVAGRPPRPARPVGRERKPPPPPPGGPRLPTAPGGGSAKTRRPPPPPPGGPKRRRRRRRRRWALRRAATACAAAASAAAAAAAAGRRLLVVRGARADGRALGADEHAQPEPAGAPQEDGGPHRQGGRLSGKLSHARPARRLRRLHRPGGDAAAAAAAESAAAAAAAAAGHHGLRHELRHGRRHGGRRRGGRGRHQAQLMNAIKSGAGSLRRVEPSAEPKAFTPRTGRVL